MQLADDLQRAIDAVELRASGEVLPAVEEGEEGGGGDRLDFAAQASDGEAVNAGEETAVAPFDFGGRIDGGPNGSSCGSPSGELASQDLAFSFQLGERLVHQVAGHREPGGQVRGAQRTGAFEPPTQNFGGAGLDGFGYGAPGGRRLDRRIDDGLRIDAAHQVEAFGGCPEAAALDGEGGGAAGGDQQGGIGGQRLFVFQEAQAAERFVQLIGVAHGRPGFRDDLCDGGGIQRGGAFRIVGGQGAAHLHGAGAALFERRVVEEGVGVGVQNLVREGRGFGRIDGHSLNRAFGDVAEQLTQAFQVHGLVEAVVDGLLDQRMVGDARFGGEIFGAGGLVGEDCGHQVVGAHALDGRRHFASAAVARDGQGARGVPAPAGDEHGGGQHGLREHVLHGAGAQKFEDDFEREGVLLAEREHDAVIGGGGLQLEIERAAEALAQGQSPGAVDAGAEGRVDDQLHAAGFVEEALGYDAVRGGRGSQSGLAGQHVVEGLLGRRGRRATIRAGRSPVRGDLLAQFRDLFGKLARAAGGLAAPEGDVGRGAVGIFDAHAAGLHAADAPGGGAEQEDVAGQALHGEILVDRADGFAFGFGHHQVGGGIGNGPAGGDGGEACAAASTQAAVDGVAMEVGAARPRLVAMPSESMVSTASKSARGSVR